MSFCEFFFLISRFYQVAGHISPVVVESDQTLIDFPDFPVGCVVWVWVGGFGVWGGGGVGPWKKTDNADGGSWPALRRRLNTPNG